MRFALMRSAVWSAGIVALGIAGAATSLRADEREAGDPNVLVLPVKTDLQQSVFGIDKNIKACVLVNSDGLKREGDALQWTSLDFEALRKALLPYQQARSKEGPSKPSAAPAVVFRIHHVAREDEDFERFRKLLRWTLVGFGQELGFRPARWGESSGLPWAERVAAIQRKTAGKTDADEPATGNELVTVHAVRTELSRHLLLNADCVVTISPLMTEDLGGGLPANVEDAIRRYVPELKLEEKGMLLFRIRCKLSAREASDKFYKSTAKSLAESLGFEGHNVEKSFER